MSKIVGRDQSERPRSAITVDHGQRSPVDARKHPLVPPLPTVAKVTSVAVPPTAMSHVARDLQSDYYTVPTVMMQRHEDARRSEFLDDTYYPSAVLPSAEVSARPALNKSIPSQGGQIWSVLRTFIVRDICDH